MTSGSLTGLAASAFTSNQLTGYNKVALYSQTENAPNNRSILSTDQILYYSIHTGSTWESGTSEFILTSFVICETGGNKVYNFQPL